MIDIPDIDAFLKEVGYYFSGTEKYTYLDVSYTFNRYYNYDNRENRLEKVKRGAELRINFTKRTVENGNINNELDIQVINEGNRFCIIISPINAGRGSSYETEIINDGYITDFYFSGYFTSTPSISDDNRTDHIMNICAEMPTEINKVDANDFVNKVMSQPEVNLDNFYTKEEVDRLIENIDIPEMPEIPEVDLSDYYDKTEVDTLLSEKANKDDIPEIPEIPENISYFNNDKGYITIDDVSNKLEKKDLSDYYDKTEVDNLLNEKANKDDIKEVDLSGYAKIKYMTQDEYDSLIEKDQFTIYLITEDE